MSNLWDKTVEIHEAMVGKLLKEQFNLTMTSISLLGEGFDNSAFLVNEQWVFRFPHRKEALACMHNEITLLPYYKKHLSFAVPDLTYIGKPSEQYPYPFVGYELLKGKLLTEQHPLVDSQEFARLLGTWLKELHQLPVNPTHVANIQGDQDWRLNIPNRVDRLNSTLEQYADYFLAAGLDPVELLAITERFDHLHISDENPVYLHADLYAKHILVNEQGLPSGFIDWGDTHIGHPAIDLSAGIMLFSKHSLPAFLEAYENWDQDLLDIANFRAFCHAVVAYAYFAQIEDYATMRWTEAAIRNAMDYFQR